jgi:hypothetical protein
MGKKVRYRTGNPILFDIPHNTSDEIEIKHINK